MSRWPIIIAALSLVFAAVAWYPSLNAKLVWDDSIVQIEQAPRIKSVGDAFFPPRDIPQWANTYYRPLVALTYYADLAANSRISGSPHNPRWPMLPHAVTLAIHALCAALLALFARELFAGRAKRDLAALMAGLIFAAHPVHAESVAFVTGRSDSMATFFLLLGLILALRHERGGGSPFAIGSALSFLMALFSKEVAATGLIIIFVLKWFEGSKLPDTRKLRFWLLPILWALAFVIYYIFRLKAGVVITGGRTSPIGTIIADLFSALDFYSLEVFYPYKLSPYIPDLPPAAIAVLGLAVFASLSWLAYKAYRGGERAFAFCAAWFLLALAPSLSTVFYNFSETRVAMRYLYLPSAGMALALGLLLARAIDFRKWSAAVGAGIILFFAALSWSTASTWGDDVSMWRAVIGDPDAAAHSLPYTNLASVYAKRGMESEAEASYRDALNAREIDTDGRALSESGLGRIYFNRARSAFEGGDRSMSMDNLMRAESRFVAAVNTGYPDFGIAKDLARTRLLHAKMARSLQGLDDPALIAAVRRDISRMSLMNPSHPETRELESQFAAFLASGPAR